MNAYRATGTRRYLADAQRALRLHRGRRLGPDGGGIWWNTSHPYKAGEALASGTLLATLLYQQTHSAFDARAGAEVPRLGEHRRASASANGLYAASNISATPIDYIEAPLIYAQALLCRLTRTPAECERARAAEERPRSTASATCSTSRPQYDAIYLQWMLALYALDGDPTLYALAADNARDAQTRALNGEGLYLLSWNGETLPAQYALPGMLQTQAATTSLFAWLAVYPPPA